MVAPYSVLYAPAAQLTQADADALGAYVPGGHVAHEYRATPHAASAHPTLHTVLPVQHDPHAAAEQVVLETHAPGGHAGAPAADAAHAAAALAPAEYTYVPAAQPVHADVPVVTAL